MIEAPSPSGTYMPDRGKRQENTGKGNGEWKGGDMEREMGLTWDYDEIMCY